MLAPPAQAAEVTALITNALKSTLTELTPAFEKTSEHKLNATYGSTEPLKVRVEKGEPIDVAVIGADAIDQLLKQNKLVTSSRVVVVRSGLGIAIRKGAPGRYQHDRRVQADPARRKIDLVQRPGPDRRLSLEPVYEARNNRRNQGQVQGWLRRRARRQGGERDRAHAGQ